MASNIIPFPSAAATGNVDYVHLLRTIQQLASVADKELDQLREGINRHLRQECIKALRDAGIPFPDISDGL